MNRISYFICCCSTLFLGCRTADSSAFVFNPVKLLSAQNEPKSEVGIEENSKQFLASVRHQAASQADEVEQLVQSGEQEIASWYRDKDDRHIEAAKQNFRKALKLQPKQNVDAVHGLAVVADLEENYLIAEQHYQLALAQSPSDPNILGNIGYSYLLQNRLAESERYLLRATQLDPANVDAVKHLGDVYAKQGQPGKAQAVLSQVMSVEDAIRIVESHSVPEGHPKNHSLLGKFLPQNGPSSPSASSDLRELRQVGQEQSRRNLALSSQQHQDAQFPSRDSENAPPLAGRMISQEQRLQGQLASIDREPYQQFTGQPMRIQSTNGEIQTAAQNQHNHERADNRAELYANHPVQSTVQESYSTGYRAQAAFGQPATVNNQSYLPEPYRPAVRQDPQSQISTTTNVYGEMSPYEREQFLRAQRSRQNFSGGQVNAPSSASMNSSMQFPYQTASGQLSQQTLQQQTLQHQQQQLQQQQYQQYQPSPQVEQLHGQAPRERELRQQLPHADPLQIPWGTASRESEQQFQQVDNSGLQPYPGPQLSHYEYTANPPTANFSAQFSGLQHSTSDPYNPRQQPSPNHTPQRQLSDQAPHTPTHSQHYTSQPPPHSTSPAQHSPPQLRQEQNAFDSASLQAARLGMGLGPGNMFTAVNETAPRHQPGTQSNWNGGSFDQAQRLLPTDLPPMDLNQASRTPPVNSLGQQLPGSQLTNNYGQFGTASRFDRQFQQSSHTSQNPALQAQLNLQRQQYDVEQQLRDQRILSNQQLQQQTQDDWNQRPLTPHQPTPQSLQMLSPAEHAGMLPTSRSMTGNSLNRSSAGEQFPRSIYQNGRSQDVSPPVESRTSVDAQSQSWGQWGYYDFPPNAQLVEPPPYRPSRQQSTERSQYKTDQVQPASYNEPSPVRPSSQYRGHSGYQMQSNSNLPMIIPGTQRRPQDE